MKQILILFILFFSFQAKAEFQYLVSYELKETYSKEILKAKWKENKISEIITPVKSGVSAYEVIYKSRWHDGSTILASGFYFVPTDLKGPFSTLVMNHGTELKKEQKIRLGGLQIGCIASAADGYISLYPHYIGLGKGEKTHLYQIAESEAIANIDMLRAVKELNEELKINQNEQLFLTGYSQGGHAAMATHQMIQEKYSNEFTVTASAPMSGAYDMTGVQSEVMFKRYDFQAYLPYLILSIQEKYKVWEGDIYEIFKEPYQSIIREKINNKNKIRAVSKLLPEIPIDMLTDSIANQVRTNPNFAFMKALEENNNYDWKPENPIMLCYCKADEQVSYKNAYVARDKMKENGAKRVIMRSGGKRFDHNTCAMFSLMNAKFFFDSFRNGSKKGTKGNIFKRMLVSIAKMTVKTKK